MRSSMLGVLSLAVLILPLGLIVPEASAAPMSKEWKTQYKAAVKELKQQNWNEYKAQKAVWKQQYLAGEITKKEFRQYKNALQKQNLLELKALKAEWKQAWRNGGGYPGAYNGGSNGGSNGGTNGGSNSVPISDTFLPFAGAFAGLVYWRARQAWA